MDLNNDGNMDLISGNYSGVRESDKEKWETTKDMSLRHGDIYIFYGAADGSFGKMEVLLNKNGDPVTRVFPNKQEESNIEDRIWPYSFDPHMVDWDLDGDLDLLLGWMMGSVAFIENQGDARSPSFSDELVFIEAGGDVFNTGATILGGGGNSSPFMVDFDGDGKRDLLVSSSKSDVFFLKNIGEDSAPQFATAQKIIAGAEGINIWWERIGNRTLDHPGKSARIYACDYNGDGKVDIILGDSAVTMVYKEGTPDERKWEIADAISRANQLKERMISGYKSGNIPKEERSKMYEQEQQLRKWVRENTENKDYGNIWLYIRK